MKTNKSGQGKVGGRLQEQRQTDELRQRHDQVQLGPGGAEPGQQSCSHRTDAEAEWQECCRPKPGLRARPLHRCNTRYNFSIFVNSNNKSADFFLYPRLFYIISTFVCAHRIISEAHNCFQQKRNKDKLQPRLQVEKWDVKTRVLN